MKTLINKLKDVKIGGQDMHETLRQRALATMFSKRAFIKKILESEWKEEESGLYQHAMYELKAAGVLDKDSDYNGMLGEAVLEIVKIFAKQGHSGGSAAMTIAMLEKLLRYEQLTPITDSPDEWTNVAERYGEGMGNEENGDGKYWWQSKRNPALFSTDGGKTYYSVDDKNREIVTSEKAKPK